MVFEPSEQPRLFGISPGVDFPRALVDGLRQKLKGQPPEAIAKIDLIVNTRRMARRLRDIFDAGPAGFLPNIRLLSDLDTLVTGINLPPATPPLRRRLELVQLVSKLITTEPTIAPRSSLYALSDSLANLIDEMQGEGVSAATIADLNVNDQSGHWERAKQFLSIANTYLENMGSCPDAQARQRQLVQRIVAHWHEKPAQHPVIIAGSTGSRGTTSMLMQAVATLPQGAIVLPGFDYSMSDKWYLLNEKTPPEDHPQYRFFDLMQRLDVTPQDVPKWANIAPPSEARNRLVSLSLRPAPVTDTWLSEGPMLSDIDNATRGLTLLEAPTPRVEALSIAMRLRQAVQEGKTAALITPDRMLTRQVTAALDRWNILPDDSAGKPLHLSPPGRFMRHVAGLFARKLDAEALLVLLRHPLTHSGEGRNQHQLNTQLLEMRIRRDGLPYPDAQGLMRVGTHAADKLENPESKEAFLNWLSWVVTTFTDHHDTKEQQLSNWVTRHLALAESIAGGTRPDESHELWNLKAGQEARKVFDTLIEHAEHGGFMSPSDYADLVSGLVSAEVVHEFDAPRGQVMIWGTLEARVQGADLVIMGGLNDGSWPEAPPPDPWLNRQMRLDAGMLLPERRIGLSAHDYQQSIAASEVWLTRSIRSDEAETVPSRWLNRLENLLNGLPDGNGKKAMADMRERGQYWIGQAQAIESFKRIEPALRPSPRPPVVSRPHDLSVTEIKRLIRDPYAIYAKHTLRLLPIDPLVQSPDAPVRGIIVHKIMEQFIKSVREDPSRLNRDYLINLTQMVLTEDVPWPTARLMWQARVERIADWFISREKTRQSFASPMLFEKAAVGIHEFKDLGFTLKGYADRIDLTEFGDVLIYDYKTGMPPSAREQRFFDKQLLLEAAMIEAGSFTKVGPATVVNAVFIGLGSTPKEVAAPLEDEPPAEVLAGLHSLIATYLSTQQGFTSRRLVKTEEAAGDYDQLARFGEWDGTTASTPEVLS
ncbi:double-strand break repair protein AddB [Sulfitobacter sp. F26204]|uniref:double-strand break repair protein AddB n=1 Tax=Sulfitobacter sp. F26204 TaxID=2996014 RepID=UPI00225E45AF|nr:double-strand break repair protein AddB [Sulfitobacter sp. F26204]MCX7558231.1 double-strand break repair protein AddB [Sulfitobacter sp. F26204]